jgi:hypothetical protein
LNRKIESLAQLAEVSFAKAKGDFEAAASFAKSLENATLDERDSLTLEEWGKYRDIAERITSQRHEFLRVIGELPPLPPARPSMFAGVVRKVDDHAGHVARPGRRSAKMTGSRSRVKGKTNAAAPAEAAGE